MLKLLFLAHLPLIMPNMFDAVLKCILDRIHLNNIKAPHLYS